MNQIFVVAAVLIATSSIALAQAVGTKESSGTISEQAVKQIEGKYADAVKRQDTLALGNILADDFIAISSRGEVRNKAQEIADIKASPDFAVEAFELDHLNVRVFKGTAVVIGRSKLKVSYKGQSSTSQFRYTRVYLKRRSGWQAIAQQLTRILQ